MDSRNEDDAGDGAGNPAADAESLPLPVNEDDAGQENHTLSKEEGDAAGSDDDGQDANDVQMQQAEQRQPLDQLDDGNERAEITADGNLADGNLADMNAAEMGADGNLADTSPTEMNAADVNLGNDTAKSLQEEVNELKIDLLSSHRNLDEAHERELQLQNQLDELSRQLSVQARASADKISRLENRVAELQHQLEDASRLQQPSPASDLRIRAAEVQELKARIKQYEIKLASSEEISSIRKEAEMERVRTDASWQHRMLSDQISRLTANLGQLESENKRLQTQLFKATRECVSSVEECNQLRRRLTDVSSSAKRVFASQNQQREEILRDIGTLANSPLKDTAKIMESLSAVSAPPAGKKKLAIENGALQPKPPAKSAAAAVGAAAAKGSPKKAAHRSDASDDSHPKNVPDFLAFMPQANGFGGGPNLGAAPGFDAVRASFDPALPPSNFNLDGDSFWTSPPKQVHGKR